MTEYHYSKNINKIRKNSHNFKYKYLCYQIYYFRLMNNLAILCSSIRHRLPFKNVNWRMQIPRKMYLVS